MVYKVVARYVQEVEWYIETDSAEHAETAALSWAIDEMVGFHFPNNVINCIYRVPKNAKLVEKAAEVTEEAATKDWREAVDMPKWQEGKPWTVVSKAKAKNGEKFELSWDASNPEEHDIRAVTLREIKAREDGGENFIGAMFTITTPLPRTHYYRLKRRGEDLVLD